MKAKLGVKRVMAAFLAALMLGLTACSTGENGSDADPINAPSTEETDPTNDPTKQFEEIPLSVPEAQMGFNGPFQGPDGTLLFMGYEEENINFYSTKDGEDWQDAGLDTLTNYLEDHPLGLMSLNYDEEGNAWLLYYEDEDYGTPRVGKLSSDGSFQEIPMDWMVNDYENGIVPAEFPDYSSYDLEEDLDIDDDSGEPEAGDAAPEDTQPEEPGEPDAEPEDSADPEDSGEIEESGGIFEMSGNYLYVDNMLALPNGNILIHDYSYLYIYDSEGNFLSCIGRNVRSIQCDGENIYTYELGENYDGSTIVKYDLDGTQIASGDLDVDQTNSYYGYISISPQGDVFFMNAEGIFTVGSDMAAALLMDGSATTLASTSKSIQGFSPLDKENFLAFFYGDDGMEVYRYTFNPEAIAKRTNILKAFTLYPSSALTQAVVDFQRQNDTVRIDVEAVLTEGNTLTLADAIRNLNTQLLAGDGPDIILLDELPIDSYIEKGVLQDISGVIEPLIGQGLMEQFARAYEEDGKIYTVPTRYSLPILYGDGDALSGISSLSDLADRASGYTDIPLLYNYDVNGLLRAFYPTTVGSWLENGEVNRDAFAAYLEGVNSLYTNGESEQVDLHLEQMGTDYNHAYAQLGFERLAQYYLGNIHAIDEELTSEFDLAMVHGLLLQMLQKQDSSITELDKEAIEAMIHYMPGQVEKTFIPQGLVSINAATGHQEIAEDFVRMMLSYDFQKNRMDDGFSVDENVMKGLFYPDSEEFLMSSYSVGIGIDENNILMFDQPPEAFLNTIYDFIVGVENPANIDYTILEMIQTETEGYFDGSASLDESIDAFISKLKLYTSA